MSSSKKRAASTVILIVYATVVMLLTLMKIESPADNQFNFILGIPADKVAHFFLFFPLAICLFLFLKRHEVAFDSYRFFWLVLCVGIVWGLAIELLQRNATTYRGEDPYDLLADSIGTLAGSALVLCFGTSIEKWIGKIFKI